MYSNELKSLLCIGPPSSCYDCYCSLYFWKLQDTLPSWRRTPSGEASPQTRRSVLPAPSLLLQHRSPSIAPAPRARGQGPRRCCDPAISGWPTVPWGLLAGDIVWRNSERLLLISGWVTSQKEQPVTLFGLFPWVMVSEDSSRISWVSHTPK